MSVWAFSDLHGRYDLWEELNKQIFKPDDILYFLGDAIDRGPDGWKLMLELLSDSRVIYIKGNHEDMLQQAIIEYNSEPDMYPYGPKFRLYQSNGGDPTWESWITAGCPLGIIQEIRKMPLHKSYTSKKNTIIELSHAGFTPDYGDIDYLWDRDHIYHTFWSDNNINKYVIHGHTPIPYLAGKSWTPQDGICQYGPNGHKFDIDMGSAYTNAIAALNLDTFEEAIIHLA